MNKRKLFNPLSVLLLILAFVLQTSTKVNGDPDPGLSTTWNGGTFDFIVVGAGIGGCVVASRLAENGKYSVLLIEEGGMPHPDSAIPAISTRFASDPTYVKIVSSVPQSRSALANNGVIEYTYGRVLGGGSTVNAMVFNRGNPSDFNEWARLVGDDSWNYENMLKYFIKAENYTGTNPSDQRGFGGPLSVNTSTYAPGRTAFLSGGTELGYPVTETNGPQSMGFTEIDYTKRFGRRASAFTAYIQPLLINSAPTSSFKSLSQSNTNLLIMIHTEAKQIIFEGNRAVGVRFVTNSTSEGFARARKEVIVSCGAIGSPVLLQKSGIGMESVLNRANIHNIVKRLPTGYNLQDHALVFLRIILNSRAAFVEDRDLNRETSRIFNERGEGPYTTFMGTAAQAFLPSSVLPLNERLLGWPDMHIIAAHDGSGNTAFGGEANHELEPDELEEGEVAVQWMNHVSRPRSRGTVMLNPRNPEGDPEIDFQFLKDPKDFQTMMDVIKFSVELCEKTISLQRIGCRLPRRPLRQCRHLRYPSKQYWECYIRQMTTSAVHGVGTNKMGRKDDPEAVVDTKLRVIGIDGLRVVDASVLTKIPNSNPQAPAYAIAEKASDMILETWQDSPKPNPNNYFHHGAFPFLSDFSSVF